MTAEKPHLKFGKSWKLCLKKDIDHLFANGKTLFGKAVNVRFDVSEIQSDLPPIRFLFIVPKKRIKKANERNLLKRRLREAARLSQKKWVELAKNHNISITVALIYQKNQSTEYGEIALEIQQLIQKLSKKLKHAQHI